MTGLQEMVFLSEIVLQVKIAHRPAERLQATHNNFDNIEVWCSIQSILVAAANVSKILWPTEKYKMRDERLRQILNVDMTNLLHDRKFRNHFEHYDDRIEGWFNNQSSMVYIDLSINPVLRGSTATRDHRGYNSFKNTVIFRGESLDLEDVLKALKDILDKCKLFVLT